MIKVDCFASVHVDRFFDPHGCRRDLCSIRLPRISKPTKMTCKL